MRPPRKRSHWQRYIYIYIYISEKETRVSSTKRMNLNNCHIGTSPYSSMSCKDLRPMPRTMENMFYVFDLGPKYQDRDY